MLLIAMTALAIGLGLYAKRFRDRRTAIAAIENLGGVMGIRYMGPEWIRRRVKDEKYFWDPAGVNFANVDDKLTDADVATVVPYMTKFQRLRDLTIRGPNITDAAIPLLIPLANKLVYLDVSGSKISTAAIKHLKKFPKLERLDISNTLLSPSDIEEFKKELPNCRIDVQ
jgi:hypothetical protein